MTDANAAADEENEKVGQEKARTVFAFRPTNEGLADADLRQNAAFCGCENNNGRQSRRYRADAEFFKVMGELWQKGYSTREFRSAVSRVPVFLIGPKFRNVSLK